MDTYNNIIYMYVTYMINYKNIIYYGYITNE